MRSACETPSLTYWCAPDFGGTNLAYAHYKAHDFERHIHDELVITVTETGFGHGQARNCSEAIQPGSIWISGAGEYHGGKVYEGGHWCYRAFYFDEKALASLTDVFCDGRSPTLPISQGVYFDPQLARLLINAHKKVESSAPQMECQTMWWSAFGSLFGRYGAFKIQNKAIGIENRKMRMARDYIAANFRENISIAELTELTGLSRFYFIRAFRNEYGLPPYAFVKQLRLIEARKLLASGASPANVASASGFYDQSHLNRLFKKAYDMTPLRYAKSQYGRI